MGKVFGTKAEEETVVAEEVPTPAPEPGEAVADDAAAGDVAEAAPTPAPLTEVDVEAVLTEMAANNSEDLDWKKSIVDLMKLVGMDSGYGDRKELALELGYTQEDINSKGSAEMNMWLHKEVMRRFAENGGRVPSDLLD